MKIVSSFISPSHNPHRPLNANTNNERANKTGAAGSNRHVSSGEFAHAAGQKPLANNQTYRGHEAIEPDANLNRNSITLTSLSAAEKQLILELRSRDGDSQIREQKRRMDLGLQAYIKQKAETQNPAPYESTSTEQLSDDLIPTSFGDSVDDTLQLIQAGQHEGASFKAFDSASLNETHNLPIGIRKMLEVQEIGANGELIKSGGRLDIFA